MSTCKTLIITIVTYLISWSKTLFTGFGCGGVSKDIKNGGEQASTGVVDPKVACRGVAAPKNAKNNQTPTIIWPWPPNDGHIR